MGLGFGLGTARRTLRGFADSTQAREANDEQILTKSVRTIHDF